MVANCKNKNSNNSFIHKEIQIRVFVPLLRTLFAARTKMKTKTKTISSFRINKISENNINNNSFIHESNTIMKTPSSTNISNGNRNGIRNSLHHHHKEEYHPYHQQHHHHHQTNGRTPSSSQCGDRRFVAHLLPVLLLLLLRNGIALLLLVATHPVLAIKMKPRKTVRTSNGCTIHGHGKCTEE